MNSKKLIVEKVAFEPMPEERRYAVYGIFGDVLRRSDEGLTEM